MWRMENAIVKDMKHGLQNEDLFQFLSKGMDSSKDDVVSNGLVEMLKPDHVFIVDSRIPKQIIGFDEQYLRYCLELMQIRALKAASCNIHPRISRGSAVSYNPRSRKNCQKICYLNEAVNECPQVDENENVVMGSARTSILGAITESKSMINILKSPLLRQSGADSSVDAERKTLVDVQEQIHSDFGDSSSVLDTSSLQKVHRDAMALREHTYGSRHVHNCVSSPSSTNSTCSDQSSSLSASPANISRGMLHCTWKNGFPHYVFSVNDQREVLTSKLLKVEPLGNKVMEYMYTFHSRPDGKKEDEIHVKDSDFIGKMKVSTSFILLADNTEIFMETRFVLLGSSDDFALELPSSTHIPKEKHKAFPKKLVDAFRASQTYKHRNSSKFRDLTLESSCDPSQNSADSLDPASKVVLPESYLPPNLELAAIIVKDHIHENGPKANVGGWGLKFLSKVGNMRANISNEAQELSKCCGRNNGECSTSMNILIPAGFHGGPRTRHGGPSSLIDRWKSGGRCDCGGWDIGCPLTVLNAMPSRTEVLSQAGSSCERKTFDLFVEGSKQDVPTMRMVNIHEGLYYIPFRSPLSAMQSFSIAVATIHTHSPNLQPKSFRMPFTVKQ